MAFRGLTRMGPVAPQKPKGALVPAAPVKSHIQMSEELEPVHAIMQEIAALKKKMEEILAAAEKKAQERIDAIKVEHKGDPGEPGQTPVINVEAIAHHAASLIPKPENGKDAVVDEKKIAKIAARHIKPPKDGDPGKDADPLHVAELVATMLKEGKVTIKADHVEGLEQHLEPLRDLVRRHNSIRGGGDTVAAGTNITITRLPNGQVQISANGGGGITALAATETPDGNTTVFTFAAATAQPSYLVVDNVWLRATTKSGTVNWTWNNGTKKATLTIAAVDEIYAIV